MTPLELWAGVECTVNRVGDRAVDQVTRSGHDLRSDDIDRIAALGVRGLRCPILWERVAPCRHGDYDWRWTDEMLARVRGHGIRAIGGLLHHGSGPMYTSLDAPDFPERFAEFAYAAAERYPWIEDWTPVNEPLTTARFSGLYGHWYPHARDDRSFIRMFLNEIRAIVLAMREIRGVIPRARLIQTEDLGQPSGTPRLHQQVNFENHRRWLTWDLLTGRVDGEHPLYRLLTADGAAEDELRFFLENSCPPDVVGINYYLTSDRWLDERTERYPPWSRGGNGVVEYADVEAVRARAKGIIGHERHLVSAWQRYGIPVALTEVHLGCTRDEQLRWLVEAWHAAERARARGADVVAVTTWALLGSFDWDSLVTQERGHYEAGAFDVRGPAPRPTALARVMEDLAAGRGPVDPLLETDGWWRRPSRLTWGPDASASAARAYTGAPILIVGARGTLGQAFARLCEHRGLRAHMAMRSDVDLSDPAGVDAVIRRVQPWAVINAAGYVRVDEAENDRHGCWRDNVSGPVNLAAACRRRGLPLVTFSSDLVFDGSSSRPYNEDDATSPLNIYGESKAAMELDVLDLMPDALVIRTSAFFGPWDQYNFAAHVRQAGRDKRVFRASDDAVVSPTYVPDLVHAVLDLLIDRESGIWHLANEGAVSWYEFARLIAAACGGDPDAIESCGWRDVWQPAVRPAYTVLGSGRGQLLRPLDRAIKAFAADVIDVETEEASRRATS